MLLQPVRAEKRAFGGSPLVIQVFFHMNTNWYRFANISVSFTKHPTYRVHATAVYALMQFPRYGDCTSSGTIDLILCNVFWNEYVGKTGRPSCVRMKKQLDESTPHGTYKLQKCTENPKTNRREGVETTYGHISYLTNIFDMVVESIPTYEPYHRLSNC